MQSAKGVEAEPDHRLVLTKEQVDKLVEQMQTAKFKEQIRELRTYAGNLSYLDAGNPARPSLFSPVLCSCSGGGSGHCCAKHCCVPA